MYMERCICKSVNELKRLEIVINVIEKWLTQVEAAGILDVSLRQMKRLVKQFRIYREEGLVSKKRHRKKRIFQYRERDALAMRFCPL